MPDNKKNLTLLVVLMTITVSVIYLYILDYADLVSNSANYFVGLAVFPVFIGIVIGSSGAFYISNKENTNIKKYYYFPLICGVVSILPIAYVLLMMSL
jgi:hypothetical protein